MMLFRIFFNNAFFIPRNVLNIVLWLALALPARAENNISFTTYYRLDQSERTSAAVLSDSTAWIESQMNNPNPGFSPYNCWVRIQSFRLADDAMLVIENAHLDSLSLFLYDSNNVLLSTVHSGDLLPFHTRHVDFHYFNFRIPVHCKTILIRARSAGSLAMPLRMFQAADPSYFLSDTTPALIFFGIFFLGLAINISFGFFLKEKIYFYYALYLTGIIISYSTNLELHFQYLFPEAPSLNKYNVVLYSSVAFVFFFCEKFLQLSTNLRSMYWIFNAYYLFIGTTAVVSLFNYALGIYLITFTTTTLPIFAIYAALRIYVKGRELQVLIFLLAWTTHLITVIVYSFMAINVLPYIEEIENLLMLGTAIEIILLMIAVVFKFNTIREEGVENRERLIGALYENERILNSQNQVLEERIKERTVELEEKNQQLSKQSKVLADQNVMVEAANNILKDNKQQLETLVERRTEELLHSNKELTVRNERLEQFSFVAAHNIRGPLSTLLGLGKLFKLETSRNTSPDYEFYVAKITESAEKLDHVVKSLNLILNLENLEAIKSERVALREIVDEVLIQNTLWFAETRTKLIAQLESAPEVLGSKIFLSTILNSLIDNSIKFKHNDQDPFISISSREAGTFIVLEYRDNSKGIDTIKYSNELFRPFKRLNETSSGAGIGLFLVKRQMEAMHGSVELLSSPGIGCHYILRFPKPWFAPQIK